MRPRCRHLPLVLPPAAANPGLYTLFYMTSFWCLITVWRGKYMLCWRTGTLRVSEPQEFIHPPFWKKTTSSQWLTLPSRSLPVMGHGRINSFKQISFLLSRWGCWQRQNWLNSGFHIHGGCEFLMRTWVMASSSHLNRLYQHWNCENWLILGVPHYARLPLCWLVSIDEGSHAR